MTGFKRGSSYGTCNTCGRKPCHKMLGPYSNSCADWIPGVTNSVKTVVKQHGYNTQRTETGRRKICYFCKNYNKDTKICSLTGEYINTSETCSLFK